LLRFLKFLAYLSWIHRFFLSKVRKRRLAPNESFIFGR
jgi:hypothetical protein